MIALATYNIKGGVGKTACAVNLAFLASREGYRTLLWDLDPQGAASFYFRIEPCVRGGGARLLRNKTALDEVIKGTDFENLDLLPADLSYRRLDLELNERKHPERRLAKRLATLRDEYDYVFIDCAPSLSLTSESIFNAVDWLLIPVIPTPLSLRAYAQLQDYCALHPELRARLMPFFSMVDRRKSMHRSQVLQFSGDHKEVLRSYIPYSSDVERMGEQRAPIGAFDGACPGARAFVALWAAVKTRIGEAQPQTP
jgi:cellulose biosynthesis protein BcsQ